MKDQTTKETKKATSIDKNSQTNKLKRESRDKKSRKNKENIKTGQDQEIRKVEKNTIKTQKIEKEARSPNKKESTKNDHMIQIHSQTSKEKDQNLLQFLKKLLKRRKTENRVKETQRLSRKFQDK